MSVAILEFTCKTPIFTAVSDGAFPNEKVYRIDWLISDIADDKVLFCNQKIFAPIWYIWFFVDAPHLMKTTRISYTIQGNIFISSIHIFNSSMQHRKKCIFNKVASLQAATFLIINSFKSIFQGHLS